MKFGQIASIHQALTVLGQERLPVAYEVAKNIKACEKVITEVQELVKTLFQTYVDRDLSGNIIEYEDGDKKTNKISDPKQLTLYQEEMNKIDAEDYDIKLTPISGTKFEGKEIAATVLMPLLDSVIVD